MARRWFRSKGGGGGGGFNAGGMINGVVGVVLQLVVGLIMLTVVMESLGDLLNDASVSWTTYPGTQSIVELFPMLMGVQMIGSSILIGMATYRGGNVNLKMAVLAPVVVVIAAVLLPTVMDAADDVFGSSYISFFNGMTVLSIIPLLYTIMTASVAGLLTFGATGRGPLGR